MKDNQFTVMLENGTEQVCNFLFNFEDEDTNRNFIFFEIVISGVCDVLEYYYDDDNEMQLKPITNEEDRNMLQEILEEYENHHNEA